MHRLALLVPLVVTLGLGACHTIDGPEVTTGPRNTSTLERDYRLANGTLLPAGTVLSEAVDATGRQFIHFRLPDGYKLVSSDLAAEDGGEPTLDDSGGITCTCQKGTGCSPFKASGPAGTVVGCSMSDRCTSCLQETVALSRAPTGLSLRHDRVADILHIAAGISFVVDPEELESLSCPKDVVFRWSGFSRGIAEFLQGVQIDSAANVRTATSRAQLPRNYTMMFINAYGKVMRVPVQRGTTISEVVANTFFSLARRGNRSGLAAVEGDGEPATDDSGATTCKCLSGSSGCVYQKKSAPLIGYAEWCEANACQSCQMNWAQAS